jgi:hypothetical protein
MVVRNGSIRLLRHGAELASCSIRWQLSGALESLAIDTVFRCIVAPEVASVAPFKVTHLVRLAASLLSQRPSSE